MKLIALLLALFLSKVFAQSSNSFLVVFKPDQITMGESQKKTVDEAASKLKNGATVTFLPLAYDSLYDLYRFTNKAKEQAQAIADYASTRGFTLIGMPRNFPSSFSGLSIGVNMKYTAPTLPEVTTIVKTTNPAGLNSFYPDKPSQFFLINPLRDTIIIGQEGTLLHFPAGSMLSKKPVEIELKEFYSFTDYLKNGLTTSSNGQLLITGGSIYLNAKESEGSKKQVGINQDIGVGVDFTLGKSDTAMQIFIKDPRNKEEFNWILPKTRTVRESWSMTEIVYGPGGKIISQKTYNSKEEWDKHVKEEADKKAFEAKITKERAQTDLKMTSKLKIYDLGYINCDKFYDEPVVNLSFAADSLYGAEYYIVYTDIRGVLKGQVNNQVVQFNSIAKDRSAVLIAVCIVDKQPYFFKCTVVNGKISSKIALQPVTEAYLDQQLAVLK